MFAPMRPTPTKPMFMSTLDLARKKWIVRFLFTHRGHGTVTRTNDRFIRQGQNFLEIVLERIIVGNVAATHGAGEKRIADDRDWPGETGHHVRHSPARVAPGQPRI